MSADRPRRSRARGRTTCFGAALHVFVAGAVSVLSGCEIVEPADSTGPPDSASPPPRPVSTACRLSPAVVAGAPAQVSGAFCFGVAVSSGDFLLCEQRDAITTLCVDEVVGLAYLVRWSGSRGTVVDVNGSRQLGGIEAKGQQSYEVATAQGQTLRAAGVCSLGVESGVSVAKFCPYTN